jgi:hypothetical protein
LRSDYFDEEVTDLCRKEYNTLDTNGFLKMREEWDKTQFLQFHQTNLAPIGLNIQDIYCKTLNMFERLVASKIAFFENVALKSLEPCMLCI